MGKVLGVIEGGLITKESKCIGSKKTWVGLIEIHVPLTGYQWVPMGTHQYPWDWVWSPFKGVKSNCMD